MTTDQDRLSGTLAQRIGQCFSTPEQARAAWAGAVLLWGLAADAGGDEAASKALQAELMAWIERERATSPELPVAMPQWPLPHPRELDSITGAFRHVCSAAPTTMPMLHALELTAFLNGALVTGLLVSRADSIEEAKAVLHTELDAYGFDVVSVMAQEALDVRGVQ